MQSEFSRFISRVCKSLVHLNI